MKKKLLLLGSVGITAGVLYALETSRRKQKRSAISEDGSAKGSRISGNDRASNGSSMASIEDGKPVIGNEGDYAIDDKGTDQLEASQILQRIRDNAFDSSNEKLALALGRSAEEIEQWTSGIGLIDGDVVMKARALAIQRGLDSE